MINAVVTGNIGKQPELKETRNGKQMVKFSIASNSKRGDGEQETTWVDCVAFENTAEAIAGNLGKGMRVIASGPMALERYQRREGGEGTSLRMIVNDIGLAVRMGKKKAEPVDEPW